MIHVYAQQYENGPAYIVGTPEDIHKLAMSLIEAINFKKSNTAFKDNQEKEYSIRIVRLEDKNIWRSLKNPQSYYSALERVKDPLFPLDLYQNA